MNNISNSAAHNITQLTLALDNNDVKRDNFELKSFQKTIQNIVYNNKGESGWVRLRGLSVGLVYTFVVSWAILRRPE